jgi:hypothetical protein
MGNRALVIFHDRHKISPTVYLHWHGGQVPDLIGRLAFTMKGRYGDAEYAAARFTGLCHELIPGNLSLGIRRNALTREDLISARAMQAISQGDAGVVVVDTGEFTWTTYGGYLADGRVHRATPVNPEAKEKEV